MVSAVLDYKHGVDGRLGLWTRVHVADVLAVWFPRTVALREHDRAAVPTALHAVLGLLADHHYLAPRSASPAELHAQVDDSTPALHDAMADERNHDLGTFWAVQLLRHDVPTTDPVAVARFLERVASGALEIDRAALAEITPGSPRRRPGPVAHRCSRCCCPAAARCSPPPTPASRRPGCGRSPAGYGPGVHSPATAGCGVTTPGRGRRPGSGPALRRPRPHQRRPARDQPPAALGAPGPAGVGRAARRALRRQQRLRCTVTVRDAAGRGVPDPAAPPLTPRAATRYRWSCSTGGCAKR